MVNFVSICICFVLAYLGLTQACLIEDELDTIFIRYYNGSTIDEYKDVLLSDVKGIRAVADPRKTSTIFIHGWNQSVNSESVIVVANAYLKARRKTHNFYAVDYRAFSGQDYLSAVLCVNFLGQAIAKRFDQVINGTATNPYHLIGHSLGAQIAGSIGRNSDFFNKYARITGLDPAGPFFYLFQPYLSKNDAHFVDVIHTDKGFFGTLLVAGNVDFYPNGGSRLQPGCNRSTTPLTTDDFCSHHRSYFFFAESVINENAFISTQCTSEINFRRGLCNDHSKIPMGFSTPFTANGTFYLRTRASSPYGLGRLGALSDCNLSINLH